MLKNKTLEMLDSILITDKSEFNNEKEINLYLKYVESFIYAVGLVTTLNSRSEYSPNFARQNMVARISLIDGGALILSSMHNKDATIHVTQIIASCTEVLESLKTQYIAFTGDVDIELKIREECSGYDPIKVIYDMSQKQANRLNKAESKIKTKKRQISLYMLFFLAILVFIELSAYPISKYIYGHIYTELFIVIFVVKILVVLFMANKLRELIN